MSNHSAKTRTELDPKFRERLRLESMNPLRGLRRLLWLAFTASAFIGLLVMTFRSFDEGGVELSDVGIQFGALILFGYLLWIDRHKES